MVVWATVEVNAGIDAPPALSATIHMPYYKAVSPSVDVATRVLSARVYSPAPTICT